MGDAGRATVRRHLEPRRVLLGIIFSLGTVLGPAHAAPEAVEEYLCEREGQIRSVTIRWDRDVTPPICDVRYRKQTELLDHDAVLWRATNGMAYCREQALALTAKLGGWGWECAKNAAIGGSSEAPVVAATEPEQQAAAPSASLRERPAPQSQTPRPQTVEADLAQAPPAISPSTPPASIPTASIPTAPIPTQAIPAQAPPVQTIVVQATTPRPAAPSSIGRSTVSSPPPPGGGSGQGPAQGAASLSLGAPMIPEPLVEAHQARLRASLSAGYARVEISSPPTLRGLGDLDGDGDSDLVVCYFANVLGAGVRSYFSVFLNYGEAGFRHIASHGLAPSQWPAKVRIDAGTIVVEGTAVDLDGAGHMSTALVLREGAVVPAPR